MWPFRKSKLSKLNTAISLTDAGMQHAQAVHGDTAIHSDCTECLSIVMKVLQAMNITPEQYVNAARRHGMTLSTADAVELLTTQDSGKVH